MFVVKSHANPVEAQRRCIFCRQSRSKRDMMRLVCDEGKSVWPDVLQKAPGRGAYVCWGECLNHLQGRHLNAAWKGKMAGIDPANELRQRLDVALLRLCRQHARRGWSHIMVGREAVMQRMWVHAPMLIVLAVDAGEALKRQIFAACDKRREVGLKTTCSSFGTTTMQGRVLERNKVSVIATNATPASKKWLQYCMWYMQLLKTE